VHLWSTTGSHLHTHTHTYMQAQTHCTHTRHMFYKPTHARVCVCTHVCLITRAFLHIQLFELSSCRARAVARQFSVDVRWVWCSAGRDTCEERVLANQDQDGMERSAARLRFVREVDVSLTLHSTAVALVLLPNQSKEHCRSCVYFVDQERHVLACVPFLQICNVRLQNEMSSCSDY